MKQAFTIALFSLVMACTADSDGNGDGADGTDNTTTTTTATSATDGTDSTTDTTSTDSTDATDASDATTGTTATDVSAQEPEWTLVPNVPDSVKQNTMRGFGGIVDETGPRPYVCGDKGVFRIMKGNSWEDRDLPTESRINACHVADGVYAAVGEQGHVWKQTGSNSTWQTYDLALEAPQLRDVWISSLQVLTVVGVQGLIYQLNVADWTKMSLDGVESTVEAIWGPKGSSLMFAAGDNLLLSYNGTEWVQDELPADPLGTPKKNQGFNAKDISGFDKDNVWAVGDMGKAAYRGADGKWAYQDTQWYVLPFNAVFALDSKDVIIAGEKGKTRRYLGVEGEPWTVMEIRTPKKTKLGDDWPIELAVPAEESMNYIGVWASDPLHIWLMDRTGRLVQFNNEYSL